MLSISINTKLSPISSTKTTFMEHKSLHHSGHLSHGS